MPPSIATQTLTLLPLLSHVHSSPKLHRLGNESKYLPVVTMHGINDDHKSCLGLISTIKESMPGVHVVNLVLGESRQKERDHSIYMGMEEQVARIEIIFSSSPNPHPMMSRLNGPAGW